MYIGIDIGGTKCAVMKSDAELNVTDKVSFPTADVDTTLERIFSECERLMPADAIGISCGGPLDEREGVIYSPPNLPGWDSVHITDMLTERFGIPAFLRNDANACALAEWRYGAGVGTRNMVFMTFGTGLGAGLILDGRLYSGTNGNAGEVGHIRLEDDGPTGYGKRGSFEGFCSGGGIRQLAIAYAKRRFAEGLTVGYCADPDSIDSVDTKTVAQCAAKGDPDAIAVFNESAEHLGKGISILIDVLNPEAIVIGSVYARSEPLFREKMLEVIKKEALTQSAAVCKILPAGLSERIGDVAAITVAIDGLECSVK